MKKGICISLFFTLLIFLIKGEVAFSQDQFAYAQSDSFFIIRFDRNVDSLIASDISNYSVDHGIAIKRALNDANDEKTIILVADQPLVEEDYLINISGLSYQDSPGEIIPPFSLNAPLDTNPWWNEQYALRKGVTHHSYWSNIHNRLTGYNIYLPFDYDEMQDSIPVIYFLGGLGNDENSQYRMWIDIFHSAIEKGDIPPTAIVFPNPMPGSWYVDGDEYKTETMIIDELLPLVDTSYRFYTSRKGRWISGFSMGGYGSLYYAFKYPELFSSVVSYSAARDVPVENPDQLRNYLSIRLSAGEVDPYFITTVLPIYNELQDLSIAAEFVSLPGVEHSIFRLFSDIGVEGVKFHWRNLGGFNEAPRADAGKDREVKYESPFSLSLAGKVEDDRFEGKELHYWWSSGENTNVSFADSGILNTEVHFESEGIYDLILFADDGEFLVSDTVTISLTSNPANKSPFVFAGNDTLFRLSEDPVSFTGISADDGLPDGSEISRAWSIFPAEGANLTGKENPAVQISFTQSGSYKLNLLASDGALTSSDSLYIYILDENETFPLLFMPFDEGEGQKVFDLVERKTAQTENAAWTNSDEKTGNFLHFPGHNSFIRIDHAMASGIFAKEVIQRTIVLEFRLINNRAAPQVLYDEGNFDNGICISKYGGFLLATVSVSGQKTILKTNFNYTEGWHHVSLVLENGEASLYLNGQKAAQQSVSGLPFTPAEEDIFIGAALNSTANSIAGGEGTVSQFYDGFLDGLAIYDESLSAKQIAALAGVEYTGINEAVENKIHIWPNPAADQINISCPEKMKKVRISFYDAGGRKILSDFLPESNGFVTLKIQAMPPGIYILSIDSKNIHRVEKIIIQ